MTGQGEIPEKTALTREPDQRILLPVRVTRDEVLAEFKQERTRAKAETVIGEVLEKATTVAAPKALWRVSCIGEHDRDGIEIERMGGGQVRHGARVRIPAVARRPLLSPAPAGVTDLCRSIRPPVPHRHAMVENRAATDGLSSCRRRRPVRHIAA